jgi:hypothetical protein
MAGDETEQHVDRCLAVALRAGHVRLELREIAAEPQAVEPGKASAAWRYEPEQRRLIVDLHESAAPQLIDLSME